jgi:hypothetical protein
VASIRGAETVIDAVLAKLRNGMAARVATINAQTNDDIPIAAPGDGDYYAFGLPGGMYQGVPAIVVTELPTPDWEAESANDPNAFIALGMQSALGTPQTTAHEAPVREVPVRHRLRPSSRSSTSAKAATASTTASRTRSRRRSPARSS